LTDIGATPHLDRAFHRQTFAPSAGHHEDQAMRRTHPAPKIALLLPAVLLATAIGCSGPAAPPLTDAREVLGRALQTTAQLRTVRVALDARIDGGESGQAHAEGTVDIAARELDMRAEAPGSFQVRVVVADVRIFSQVPGEAWSITGGDRFDPLADLPTTARVAEAVLAGIADPRTTLALGQAEPCGSTTWYRVTATIPPAVSFAVLARIDPRLAPMEGTEPEFPDIGIEALVEYESFLLVRITNSVAFGGNSGSLTIDLADHNRVPGIEAPADAVPR
jgi:hypothetical protein